MASQVNGYIGQVNPGNGTNYAIGSTAYGLCETAAATAAKTADMTGFTLNTGATVFIKFTYANTATTAPTLNVNGTGAKSILSMDGRIGGWNDGAIVCLTYDGTNWRMITDNWANAQFLADKDVNDLREPGNYILPGALLADYTYASNLPQVYTLDNITWHIEVKNVNQATIGTMSDAVRVEQYAHAIYFINSTLYSFQYFRYSRNTAWSEWQRENPWQAEKLIAKSGATFDLNTLLTPGRYCSGAAVMNYVTNKPVSTSGKGWEIFVRELITDNRQYILQEARDGSNLKYWRTTADSGTTWTDWVQDTATLNVTTDQEKSTITLSDNTGTQSSFDINQSNGMVKFYQAGATTSYPYIYIHLGADGLFDGTATRMIHGKICTYPYNNIVNFNEIQFNFYYRNTTDAVEYCYYFDHFNKMPSMAILFDSENDNVIIKIPHIARYTTYTAEAYCIGSDPTDNLVSSISSSTPSGTFVETAFTRRTVEDAFGSIFQPTITASGILSGDGAGNITGATTATTSVTGLSAEIINVSSNLTITTSHAEKFLLCTGTRTITIPTGLLIGMEFEVMNYGTGVITVKAASGVTLNGTSAGSKTIDEQYTSAILKCVASNTWVIQGAIS